MRRLALRSPRRVLGWLALALLVGSPAPAFEFFEGRLELHGFAEVQLRAIARDFDRSDGVDLTQWYNVLNLELEYDFAPDGWGPFLSLSAYSRVEVRFDCVWTRACGLFSSADSYGDRANELPDRLSDGVSIDGQYIGSIEIKKRNPLVLPGHRVGNLSTSSFGLLVTKAPEPQQIIYMLNRYRDFRFGSVQLIRDVNGRGPWPLSAWNPKNEVFPLSGLGDIANPFNPNDPNPAFVNDPRGIGVISGVGALPFRPAPVLEANAPGQHALAQGIYYPHIDLVKALGPIDRSAHDQNFSQSELQWNRGASQQDEKELKELYLDFEVLDGALWGRVGKQAIVWGKTELFRNQDQFNPQDLALASLPSLEESRIALWAARFVYSFYEIRRFQDVRLELAFLYDEFEPADLGDCGEPYAVDLICRGISEGLFQHGVNGLGIAGFERPDNPWDSLEGLEAGARLEFRYGRFSFAITNYYGFTDTPIQRRYTVYERNVDPTSGRLRAANARGPCRVNPDGTLVDDPDCLQPVPVDTTDASLLVPNNALQYHPANQHVFAFVCGGTVGSLLTNTLAVTLLGANGAAPYCFSSLFNEEVIVGQSFSQAFAGFPLVLLLSKPPAERAAILDMDLFVQLNQDFPQDGVAADGVLSSRLTDSQEALLGCGRFFGTSCDPVGVTGGFDLLNAEASVFLQAFTGFEGSLTQNPQAPVPQPGTVPFAQLGIGGPVGTRNIGTLDRPRLVMLPGSRGPGDPGYDPTVDGTVAGLTHPYNGSLFRSEMAALSWNAFMASTVVSTDTFNNVTGSPVPFDISYTGDVSTLTVDLTGDGVIDGDDAPCSLVTPLHCNVVAGFFGFTSLQNPKVTSNNRNHGRRDFTWHAGAPLYLKYEKNNYLGFSTDFAEDRTATNWNLEFTWVNDRRFANGAEADNLSEVDEFNLTVSVDRPTFINFLNQGRTFFMNMQTFFQYIDGYRNTMPAAGPWNVLQTFSVFTGYFQDRLNPGITLVYDWGSNSGAILPSIDYRFSENFRLTFGVASFFGRQDRYPLELLPTAPRNRVGRRRYEELTERGLGPVQNRDEVYLRIRYSF